MTKVFLKKSELQKVPPFVPGEPLTNWWQRLRSLATPLSFAKNFAPPISLTTFFVVRLLSKKSWCLSVGNQRLVGNRKVGKGGLRAQESSLLTDLCDTTNIPQLGGESGVHEGPKKCNRERRRKIPLSSFFYFWHITWEGAWRFPLGFVRFCPFCSGRRSVNKSIRLFILNHAVYFWVLHVQNLGYEAMQTNSMRNSRMVTT